MRLACLVLACAGLLSGLEPAGTSLTTIKRIYVESLGGSPPAIMLHDMVVTSLTNCGYFFITEKADNADAILRGSADDQVFDEQHHSTDSISAGLHGGSSSYSGGSYKSGGSRSTGLTLGQNETNQSVERRHEAQASVRLINRDGDVIWSTTQESAGGKFRGASADVADKILRKLTEDVQKARLSASAAMQAGMPTR